MGAQGDGTAATAGATSVDILLLEVENQCAAVSKLPAQSQTFLPCQGKECFLTHLAQVAGDDQIKVTVDGMQIVKMCLDGSKGCWG